MYISFLKHTVHVHVCSCRHLKIAISNETDRDKLSFGFWSHLTRFNTIYKANAKTFLTSDCTFTQWRAPWWIYRLFTGSCLLPITTLHILVPRQTRYRYYANWHPQYFLVIQNLFLIAHYTYENIRYGYRFWFLRSVYMILPKCSYNSTLSRAFFLGGGEKLEIRNF